MGHETSLSAKGQVVIPKDVRNAMGLTEGARFDVHMIGGNIVFRPKGKQTNLSTEEILKSVRDRYPYKGPPVSIEDMNETIRKSWVDSALRRDK
jgi:AbrB family looped-hinge helix DNA binding protein